MSTFVSYLDLAPAQRSQSVAMADRTLDVLTVRPFGQDPAALAAVMPEIVDFVVAALLCGVSFREIEDDVTAMGHDAVGDVRLRFAGERIELAVYGYDGE